MNRDLSLMNLNPWLMKRYPWHIERDISQMKRYPWHIERDMRHIKRDLSQIKRCQGPFEPKGYDITTC